MEPQHHSFDIISTLPPSIIDTILCRIPIEEAARTSVLSKEWRYKWTKIPKLVFSEYMFKNPTDDEIQASVSKQTIASERKKMGRKCKLFYAMYQVLLMRQAPIHEFTLFSRLDKTCVEIDHIISYLSRNNAVKKLKLNLFEANGAYYRLPLSVFSLHHLANLYLRDCDINVQPTFSGFARLTKLYLYDVYISMETLLHFISSSPRLKHFTLKIDDDHLIGNDKSTVIELFKYLPMIEHLSTYCRITECFVIDSVPQGLPTLLIHLKYFSMDYMCFSSAEELRFIALLIRSSPNLEKIKLHIHPDDFVDEKTSVIRECYSDIWLEHLNVLKMTGLTNLESELEFVKFILAKSPKLKKVGLCFVDLIDKTAESEILRILLQSPPASPVVEIIFSNGVWFDQLGF